MRLRFGRNFELGSRESGVGMRKTDGSQDLRRTSACRVGTTYPITSCSF